MGSWWFHDDKPSNLWFSLKPKFLPGMEWEWTFSWPFLVALVMNHPHYIPTIWKTLVKSSMIYHLVGGFMKKQYMWDWLRRWLLHFCWHGLFFFNHQQWLDHGRAFGETRLPLQRFGVSHPRGSRAGGSLALGCFSPMREKTVRPVQKKGVTKFAVAVLEPCPIMFHFLGCQLCLVTWNLVITYYIITVKLSNPRPGALLFLTRGSWNNWVTSQNHPKPWFLHENNDPPFWMMWGSPIFKIPPVSSSALLLVQKMNCWGCGNHQALDKGQRRSRPAPCLIWGS